MSQVYTVVLKVGQDNFLGREHFPTHSNTTNTPKGYKATLSTRINPNSNRIKYISEYKFIFYVVVLN